MKRACTWLFVCFSACASGSQSDAVDDAGANDPSDAAVARAPDGEVDVGRSDDDAQPVTVDDASDARIPDDASVSVDAESARSLALCPLASRVDPACTTAAEGMDESTCDGLDNDCDGEVDEGCSCIVGTVQRCFPGPPGHAHTGACSFGTQVCAGGEFPSWGACSGATAPSDERCDGLDNDCNGCTDEIEACVPVVDCPAALDPRIPSGRPFDTIHLEASAFVDPAHIVSAHWTVRGSPCDTLFSSIPGSPATAENGQLSYQVSGADTLSPSVHVSLSGSYAVSVALALRDGSHVTCDFPMQVKAEGLRVELCWDATGPTAGASPVDLDLHLAKKGATTRWFDDLDCNYKTCVPRDLFSRGIWGHPNTTDVTRCLTNGPLDFVHQLRGNCINPRLDIDNQGEASRYLPENINLDAPVAGEVFEIGVNHRSSAPGRTRALVNVYCGGNLRGSFQIDRTANFSDATSKNELWRVANIAIETSDASGITRCGVSPLTSIAHASTPDLSDGDRALRFTP